MPKKQRNGVSRTWHGSRWLSPRLRLAIYLRDGFLCLACGVSLSNAKPADITLDHIRPHSLHGEHKCPSNLYTCCRSCNSSRKAQRLALWASGNAVKLIRKHTRRSIKRYLRLATALLAERQQGCGS